MPALINGSPTHALIVHAVVVLLPLAVLGALGLVFIPASRRAFGLATVLIGFAACVAVPLAFLSGSALRQRLPPSPLINHHVALAHQLLPVAAVFGLSLAAFVAIDLVRRGARGELNQVESALLRGQLATLRSRSQDSLLAVSRIAAVVLVVMAAVTAVAVVRVGDSGAKAAWHNRLASTSQLMQPFEAISS
jgi:hypothetical protein